MDLFDIQNQIKALSTHVHLCCPQLASHFCSSSVRVSSPVDSDLPAIQAGRQLSTLCQLLTASNGLGTKKSTSSREQEFQGRNVCKYTGLPLGIR